VKNSVQRSYDDLAGILAEALPILLFDSAKPFFSGSLAGESFAATVENHPRYPGLRSDDAMFGLLDAIVADHIDSLSGILHGLGFDKVDVGIYRAAALAAFRAVRPQLKTMEFRRRPPANKGPRWA
jgi:hypothetical protein